MTVDRTEPFKRFLSELRAESDRGLALVGAAFIDERLAEALQAFFLEGAPSTLLQGANAPLGAFAARIELCHALGLIEEFERHECDYIRKIRNEFAHEALAASFERQKISGLCSNLRSELPEPEIDVSARAKFGNSIVTMAIRLLYRDVYVGRERREIKQWVDPGSVKWRRTTEEEPPRGSSVVAAWWPRGIFGEWKI